MSTEAAETAETAGTGQGAAELLIEVLDRNAAGYRLIEHAPEGRTEVVSALRGNRVEQAAKCIVVRTKLDKKTSAYVLAVVPGDRRVDLDRVREHRGARVALFADAATAERLTAAQSGAIVPFSFEPSLELLVDPAMLEHEEIFFNAGALDRSIALRTEDYVRIAQPTVKPIAQPPEAPAAEAEAGA